MTSQPLRMLVAALLLFTLAGLAVVVVGVVVLLLVRGPA